MCTDHAPSSAGWYVVATYQVIQDLIPYDADHFKTLLRSDGIDNHVAMDSDKVLAVQDGVLILAGGIDDLHTEFLVPMLDDFAERVLDGGVV